MKKADLEELPVLNLRELSSVAASRVWLACLTRWLRRSSNGCREWSIAQTRQALDDGISQNPGYLPDLANLRSLLASEPVVSNRRL